MKSRVLIMEEPIEQLSAAYMKELRNNNKTKKVYDVDPYAEVYQFRDNVYGIYTQSLDGMGDPWMYLVVGAEKALLIDTSFGLGDLKGLVDEITGGMEVILVNTHASVDHSFGNCQFDRAYCHEYAVPYMEQQKTPTLWDRFMDENGNGIWAEFDKNDIIKYKDYEIIGVPNGYTWDLGDNHEIELIFLPGHQAGHAGFLDKKNRILFCGDDFLSMRVGIGGGRPGMPYNEYACVQALRDELVKLVDRLDEFDTLFPGHFIVDISSDVVPNMLEACNEIVADPNDYDYIYNFRGRDMRMKFVKGLGTIGYGENSVYPTK